MEQFQTCVGTGMGCTTAVTQCGCHWLPIHGVGEWLLLLVQGTFLFRNCCCYSTGESRLVLRSCAGLHPNPSPGQPPGYCSESATGLLLSLRARACCNDDKSMHEAESQASFLLFLLLLLCKVGLVLQHSRGQEVTEKTTSTQSWAGSFVLVLFFFGGWVQLQLLLLLLGRSRGLEAALEPAPRGSPGRIACQRCCQFAFLLGPEVGLHADCCGAGNALQASCQLCALRAPLTLGFPPPLLLRLHGRLVLLLERLELQAMGNLLVCEPLLQSPGPFLLCFASAVESVARGGSGVIARPKCGGPTGAGPANGWSASGGPNPALVKLAAGWLGGGPGTGPVGPAKKLACQGATPGPQHQGPPHPAHRPQTLPLELLASRVGRCGF